MRELKERWMAAEPLERFLLAFIATCTIGAILHDTIGAIWR